MIELKFYKIYPTVKSPVFSTEGSACFDVFAHLRSGDVPAIKSYDEVGEKNLTPILDPLLIKEFNDDLAETNEDSLFLIPFSRYLIPTGLIFDIPDGHSLRGHIRSSVAFKKGIILVNSEAVIDQDYFHEVFIMVMNLSHEPMEIKHGDRLAQFELVPTLNISLEEINVAPKQTTNREGGIGSTGE